MELTDSALLNLTEAKLMGYRAQDRPINTNILCHYASVVQLEEQMTFNHRVPGSRPGGGTTP